MMKKRSVLGFLADLFMIYGITTAILNIFCILFGAEAQGFSSIFAIGGSGVSTAVSFEFLLTIACMMGVRYIFMTDIFIKDMSLAARTVLMFIAAFLLGCGAVALFGWFPVDLPLAWILIIVCFTVSCSVSTAISLAAEKQENRRLEQALKKYKEEN